MTDNRWREERLKLTRDCFQILPTQRYRGITKSKKSITYCTGRDMVHKALGNCVFDFLLDMLEVNANPSI